MLTLEKLAEAINKARAEGWDNCRDDPPWHWSLNSVVEHVSAELSPEDARTFKSLLKDE
jgi:hypothetical protein